MKETKTEATGQSEGVAGVERVCKVTVCPITGRQFWFLTIPHRLCEECDLTIRMVRGVIDDLGDQGPRVELEVKPWLRHIWDHLRRGGWHPPVVAVDGKIFSQGVVPDPDALRATLLEAAGA